jgi:hypothetical protein
MHCIETLKSDDPQLGTRETQIACLRNSARNDCKIQKSVKQQVVPNMQNTGRNDLWPIGRKQLQTKKSEQDDKNLRHVKYAKRQSASASIIATLTECLEDGFAIAVIHFSVLPMMTQHFSVN